MTNFKMTIVEVTNFFKEKRYWLATEWSDGRAQKIKMTEEWCKKASRRGMPIVKFSFKEYFKTPNKYHDMKIVH